PAKLQAALRIVQRSTNGDDVCNSRRRRALQHGVELLEKPRIGEMAVGVNHLDCFLIVISKFFTIDLYIVQTTAVYAPTAIQVKMKTNQRAVVMSSGLGLPGSRKLQGLISIVSSVKGLKLPATQPARPMPWLSSIW